MLIDYFKDKKILIAGFGREGQSTYSFIRKHFPQQMLSVADQSMNLKDHALLAQDAHICWHLGTDYLSETGNYELIMRSPGIPLVQIQSHASQNTEISSQTGLFLQHYANQTIGITGTKGKSTTAHLLYEVLVNQNFPVLLGGNMGIPLFDIVEKVKDNTWIVCEFSAHQLTGIKKAPYISILLNLFEEHLDYYRSYKEYIQAKMNIALFQGKEDMFVFSHDNDTLISEIDKADIQSKKYAYSLHNKIDMGCYLEEGWVVFKDENVYEKIYPVASDRNLKGLHNLSNILSVCIVGRLLGISSADIASGISKFKGLEHRLEYIGEYHDIIFYNDSISTIPQAAIEAVTALIDVDTLILGGFDRGIDYSPLCAFLEQSSVNNLVFIGEAGKRIKEIFPNEIRQKYIIENDYKEIVKWCFKNTQKGKICLLSPAASSYDAFTNFEERGAFFKRLVMYY